MIVEDRVQHFVGIKVLRNVMCDLALEQIRVFEYLPFGC